MLCCWLLCTALGAASIMPYIGLVGWDSQHQLPDTLQGKIAMSRWYSYFPEQARGAPTVGVIRLRCATPGQHGCPASVLSAAELQPLFQQIGEVLDGRARLESYAEHIGEIDVASRFITPDGSATMFLVCCDWQLDAQIEVLLTKHNPDPTKYWMGITSRAMLNQDSIASVKRDLPLIDSICVPLAFALMGYMLRSPRLVIVAACSLVCVVMTTFLVLYIVCKTFDMVPDPTQLNFVVIIALGLNFDYSLFLLDRFRTSVKSQRSASADLQHAARAEQAVAANAVLEMLRRVTPVVTSSGLTLTTVFSGFLFLTSGNLVGAGLGCAITVVLCMLVSLTLLPVLLLTAPTFFSTFCEPGTDRATSPNVLLYDGFSTATAPEPLARGADLQWHSLRPEQRTALRNSRTVAIVRRITTHPCNLLTVLALFTISVAFSFPAMEISLNNDISQTASRGGMAFQTLAELGALSSSARTSGLEQHQQYAGFIGYTDELHIVVEASSVPSRGDTGPSQGATSALARLRRCGLNETAQIARQLQSLREPDLDFRLSPPAIFAAGWARGRAVTAEEHKLWTSGGSRAPNGYALDIQQRCGGDCFRASGSGRTGSAATIISVLLPVNPGSAAGNRFIEQARTLLRQREETQLMSSSCHSSEDLTLRYFLADPQANVVSYDMMLLTFEEFKKMLVGICVLLGLLVGVMLRSAFVPMRLALTLILPLASVFGAAVLVYQDGALGWLGWSHIAASNVRTFL